MLEYAQEIVPFLIGVIIAVGSALISLVVYIGRRMDKKVEALPALVATKVAKVHDEILVQLSIMNLTHKELEHDLRIQGNDVERRLTRLESFCEWQHSRGRSHDETT
jgi:hypothetical protein